jgi:dihydroorotase
MEQGHRLVVSGGTLVVPSGRYSADIVCAGDRIEAICEPGTAGPADLKIDARNRLVFPGFIDPHVHSRDPGLTHKEDFAHATRAAVAGGVTTIFEMPNTVPPVSDVEVLRARVTYHEPNAYTDFGLWGISLGRENLHDISGLVTTGAIGIKLFWGYAFGRKTRELVYDAVMTNTRNLILPPSNPDVYEVFTEVSRVGGLVAVHCEDRALVTALEQRGAISSYADFLATRPEVVETSAIAVAVEFARATGCRFHVVHVSSRGGVAIIRNAQQDGVPITAETCPQYLTLADTNYPTIGPMMKVFPPIRESAHQGALWEAIADGTIGSVGSDHAPHTVEEKSRELAAQPAGMIGVETCARVLVNEMLSGRLTAERLAWVLSEGTARIFGVYPRKGAILPGSDADFTIVDPGARSRISNTHLHSKNAVSAWDGQELRGRLCTTVLRGRVVMSDGEPRGDPRGTWIRPASDAWTTRERSSDFPSELTSVSS